MESTEVTLPGHESTTVGDGRVKRNDGPLVRGTVIGRYVVTGLLGSGGMGVVYAAYDPELDRKVAIKLMHGAEAKESPDEVEAADVRFMREAQAMAKLRHPNVVTVHDVGTWQDQLFVAMELVDGWTLSQWLIDEKPSWREALKVLVSAGRGLAAAHERGLVHRDFKPDNILVARDGSVVVTDFGLARPTDVAGVDEAGNRLSIDGADLLSADLTRTGALVGTPAYMAPELFDGDDATPASDQFAFCVTAFAALYGHRPFEGESLAELIMSVTAGQPREPEDARKLPVWLRRAIERGLCVDPAQRWPSMSALLQHLSHDPSQRWRRRLVVAAAAAGAATLAGGLASWGTSDADACPPPDERLTGVWDDQTKAAIADRFEASELPYADAAWQRSEPALDAYTKQWVEASRQACLDTRVRGQQSEVALDLRLACLERRHSELAALVKALQNAEPRLVARASDAVRDLTPLEACADLEELRAGPSLPDDPELRARIERLQSDLDSARAALLNNGIDGALQTASSVIEAGDDVGYPPLVGRAYSLRADALIADGEYEAAREALEAGLDAAAQGHDDDLSADLWISTVFLVGYHLEKTDEALALAEAAEHMIVRAGDEPHHRSALDSNLGSVLKIAGELDRASVHHERSLQSRRERFGEDDPRTATALANLGNLRYAQGRYEEALELISRALVIREAAYGPEHPDVASARNNLGGVCYAMGRFEEALDALGQALATRRALYDEDHPLVIAGLGNVGSVLMNLERHDEAETYLRQAHELTQRRFGPDHARAAQTASNLGNVLERLERHDEALALHREAIAISRATIGAEDPKTALRLTNLGVTLRNVDRLDEAEASFREALRIYEAKLDPDHPQLALPLDHLAEVLADRNRHAAAAPLWERSISIREKSGAEPQAVAVTRGNLARTLWALGRERERALQLARSARDDLRASGLRHDDLAEIEAWLARVDS